MLGFKFQLAQNGGLLNVVLLNVELLNVGLLNVGLLNLGLLNSFMTARCNEASSM
jgi:hypothetical protein